MDAVLLVTSVLVGLITGSFLNVVILRLPRGTFRSGGQRSHCPHCEAQIGAFDNIPVLSYLLLKGRARCCGKPIHWRYPVIEACTALLFLLVYLLHSARVPGDGAMTPHMLVLLAVDFVFVAVLFASSVIDLEHRILPDAINLPGIPIALVLSLLLPELHAGGWVSAGAPELSRPMAALFDGVLGMAIGAGVLYAVAWIGKLAYRMDAMGLGDVKFMAMVGALIGPRAVLLAMLAAVLLGAVIGLIASLRTRDPHVPFGPFLAVGALASHFFEERIAAALFEDFPKWLQTSPYGMPSMLLVCLLSFVALFLLRRVRLGAGDDAGEGEDDPNQDDPSKR